MIKCPVCKGDGEIDLSSLRKRMGIKGAVKVETSKKQQRVQMNTIMAKLLRQEGYSFREIAKFLGYASPRSVQMCLKREI